MKKWITCSDLCGRWNINQYDLAELVINGKFQAVFGNDFSYLNIVDGGSFVESPDGQMSGLSQKPLTVDEVTDHIFRISDVEKFERKSGISPHSPRGGIEAEYHPPASLRLRLQILP